MIKKKFIFKNYLESSHYLVLAGSKLSSMIYISNLKPLGYCPAINVSTMLVHQVHVISRHIHHYFHHRDLNRLPLDYERNNVLTRPCLHRQALKGAFKNYIILFWGFLDPPSLHISQNHLLADNSLPP